MTVLFHLVSMIKVQIQTFQIWRGNCQSWETKLKITSLKHCLLFLQISTVKNKYALFKKTIITPSLAPYCIYNFQMEFSGTGIFYWIKSHLSHGGGGKKKKKSTFSISSVIIQAFSVGTHQRGSYCVFIGERKSSDVQFQPVNCC